MTAIYIKDQKISYRELISLINEVSIEDPIFPVTRTLDCVMKILHCLIKGIAFLPYNPNLHKKPDVKIPDDVDLVLHTSGSSKMKYVLFSKKAVMDANIHTHRDFMLGSGDVYLLNLPLFHIAGIALLLRSFLRGAAIAIDPSDHKIVTHISAVPTQALKLGNKNTCYPRLKSLLIGGAPIKKDLAECLMDLHYPLFITYGMTEMSSHVFVERYRKKRGLSFKAPLRGREVFLDKESILHVSGCGKFLRYLEGCDEATYRTKDTFIFENSRYYFKGRADSLFISGGENIYPEEIERELLLHPSIVKVQIEIKEDLKWGKRPYVSIYSNCKNLTKGSVTLFLENKLEKFKIPKIHEIHLCN